MPSHAQSLFEDANRAYNSGDYRAALPLADAAIAVNPRDHNALHLRGLIALALNALDDAQAWLERAVASLAHPVFCNSLCVAQTRARAYAAAAESARLGLRMAQSPIPDADTSMLWYNLGLALQLDDQFEAAAESYRQTLARQPDHAMCHNNLGTVTNELGDLHMAIAHFERAIALDPGNLRAHSNLGHALLAAGRFQDAWPYFEQRWASLQTGAPEPHLPAPKPPSLPIPRWNGEPLAGDASLLVLHEQGFGDVLQFCRYLPMALERCKRVGFVCLAPLRRLLENSLCARWPNLVLLDDVPEDLSAWSRYCALLSLPVLFDTRLDTVPAAVPYLYAEPQRARNWAERLAALGDDGLPRVGMVWAGGHTATSTDRRRSIATDDLMPLLSYSGARWISLQRAEEPGKRLSPALRSHVVDWMDEIDDFADTAALVDGLDLVISVDTSVAHLAAAMGKRVWLLNRFSGCWRWLRDREDSPWYPGLRLFTQRERGNWGDVLARVRADLERVRV